MKQLVTVLKFEYLTFVKSTSFLIMTVILVLAGLIMPAIPSFGTLISNGLNDGKQKNQVAVVDSSGVFTTAVFSKYLSEPAIHFYESTEAAQTAVSDGSCDFGIAIEDYAFTLYVPSMKVSFYSTQERIDTMIRSEYRMAKLQEAGLDSRVAEGILDYVPSGQIVTVAAPSGDNAKNYQENIVYAYAMLFLLYFGLLMYGQYILTSVVREKTTKTMELLVTSCKADKLVNGKVLGVGLAGLTQMALIVVAALGSMYMVSRMQPGGDTFVVAVNPGIIALMVVFFMLGFFAFAYMYAALGSTVSRMEDANSVAFIPMMLIIIGFMASIFGMFSPDVIWVKILSYVPFVSPMVMFMRVCMGTASWWGVAIAIVIQLAAILLSGWLGARIYRLGTLLYGNKPGIKTLVRLLK